MWGQPQVPSRTLNEERAFLGLYISDLALALLVFIVTSSALQDTKYGSLAFPLGVLTLLILVPIRLKFRRKIIRDTVSFFLTDWRSKDV